MFLLFKIMKRILIILFLGILHNFCSAQELKKVTPNYSNKSSSDVFLPDTLNIEVYIERYIYQYKIDNQIRFSQEQSNFKVKNTDFLLLPISVQNFIINNKKQYSKKFEIDYEK
jgi:hypothetical protein